MRKASLVALLVVHPAVHLAACAKGGAKGGAVDCAAASAAGEVMATTFLGQLKPASAGSEWVQARAREMAAGYRKVIATRCAEDGWAPEVMTCLTEGKLALDLDVCRAKLTKAQRTKLDGAMNAQLEEVLRLLKP